MLVYRIEHNDIGKGPYRSELPICRKLGDKHIGPNWPQVSLSTFMKVKKKGRTFFGFSSLRELMNWFSEDEILELYDNGFCITVYKVHKKFVSKDFKQCCFVITESDRIKKIDFDLFCRLV
jgi:hypothetical protein